MALPVIPLLVIGAGILYAFSSSSSSSSSSGGGGGGGLDLLSCEQAFALLPKEIRDMVNTAVASPTFTATQREAVAKTLEEGGAKITDAKMRNAFNVAASCVRAVKLPGDGAGGGGGGGGGGGLNLESCESAFAGLPSFVQGQIDAARTSLSPSARTEMAAVLEASAASPLLTDPQARQRLLAAAQCLRAEAAKGVGPGSKFNRKPGTAVDPNEQVLYRVVAGDNASKITAAVIGVARTNPSTYRALVELNPRELDTGRVLGSVGTPGTASYNWASLLAGDHIKIPREWNIYIDAATYQSTHGVPLPSA